MTNNILNDLSGIQMLKNLNAGIFKENSICKTDYFDGLPNLEYLDLSYNKLRVIERSNIGLLPLLKSLLLDFNYLKVINGFSKITSLCYFSIESNKITEYSGIERLTELENLKELNLTNNPIQKNYNYRQIMCRRFIYLSKLDLIVSVES